jgi:Tripartite tricarboxylate transporter TctB family
MKLQIRNQSDFSANLLFAAVGMGFSLAATRYDLGTAAQMGPALFPLILGAILALFGVIVAVRSVTPPDEEERIEPIFLKPFALVLGSVALFAVLLVPLGLVVSSFVLVITSALASHEFHWKYTILTAATLIAGCYTLSARLL